MSRLRHIVDLSHRTRKLNALNKTAMPSEKDIARASRKLRCAMRVRAGEANPWAGFLSSIPAEETDEEFAAQVES